MNPNVMQPGGIRPRKQFSNSKPPGSRGLGTAGSRVRSTGQNGIRAKSNGRQGPMGMGMSSGKYLQNAAP